MRCCQSWTGPRLPTLLPSYLCVDSFPLVITLRVCVCMSPCRERDRWDRLFGGQKQILEQSDRFDTPELQYLREAEIANVSDGTHTHIHTQTHTHTDTLLQSASWLDFLRQHGLCSLQYPYIMFTCVCVHIACLSSAGSCRHDGFPCQRVDGSSHRARYRGTGSAVPQAVGDPWRGQRLLSSV